MTETSAGEAGAPEALSEERLAEIQQMLAADETKYELYQRPIVAELAVEVERLNKVLDANRVVRNAAESSSRTYKGAMELLKTQRTQLRAERDAATLRAETAERELAGLREQPRPLLSAAMAEVKPELVKQFEAAWAKAVAEWDGTYTVLPSRTEQLGPGEVQWTTCIDGEDGSPMPEKLARLQAQQRGVPLMTRTAYANPPWREVADHA